MSGQTDIMAWMQKVYIDAHPAPWYRKIALRFRLLIERKFRKIKNAPGAQMLDALEAEDKARRLAKLRDAGLAQTIKQEALTRQQRARMLDSL